MWLSQPLTGWWPFDSYPPEILVYGRPFRMTAWANPFLEGVVVEYREVGEPSGHMRVYANGTWVIDHVDCRNPDEGNVIEHAVTDTSWGPPVVALGIAALAIAAGIALDD